jgi:hypothetical protein
MREAAMLNHRKQYIRPVISEVKFQDKNLVMFRSCSKNDEAHNQAEVIQGCCVDLELNRQLQEIDLS